MSGVDCWEDKARNDRLFDAQRVARNVHASATYHKVNPAKYDVASLRCAGFWCSRSQYQGYYFCTDFGAAWLQVHHESTAYYPSFWSHPGGIYDALRTDALLREAIRSLWLLGEDDLFARGTNELYLARGLL